MMNRPASTQILKNDESYYSLVTAVAKRARQIATEYEEHNLDLLEKPVQLAIEEFAEKKYVLIEPENIGSTLE